MLRQDILDIKIVIVDMRQQLLQPRPTLPVCSLCSDIPKGVAASVADLLKSLSVFSSKIFIGNDDDGICRAAKLKVL